MPDAFEWLGSIQSFLPSSSCSPDGTEGPDGPLVGDPGEDVSHGELVSTAADYLRFLRALRDALLIGGSILVIWLVLHTAGIMIPFTVMLAIVLVIVIISFAAGVFGQMRKARQQAAAPPPQG